MKAPTDDLDLPVRQARLRDACCVGDVRCELIGYLVNLASYVYKLQLNPYFRSVERLLSSQACGWRGVMLRFLSVNATQVPFPHIDYHGDPRYLRSYTYVQCVVFVQLLCF